MILEAIPEQSQEDECVVLSPAEDCDDSVNLNVAAAAEESSIDLT